MHTPTPLTLAGSDPTGGAGIEADLKVFLAHGLSGAAIATAHTVQDSVRVHAVHAESEPRFRRRLDVLLADMRIAGTKIGLIPNTRLVRAIAAAMSGVDGFIILDPVLAPTRGPAFLDATGVRTLIERLFPRVDLITPNLAEAAMLIGRTPRWVEKHPEAVTARLRETGVHAVLLKGGHAAGPEALDILDQDGTISTFVAPRIEGAHARVHGTGCALSSAILSRVLLGAGVVRACAGAKAWVHAAIEQSRPVGRGRRQLEFDGARAKADEPAA